MITRKIVQHGGSTLTISLPYRWINRVGIKKGDTIFISETGNDLILSFNVKNAKKMLELNFDRAKPYYNRYLLHAYRQGYTEIIMSFENSAPIDYILKQLDQLLGFEIVEQDERKLVIKDVASIKPEEFHAMLKRLFIMDREFLRNLSNAKPDHIDKEVNKLANYCLRASLSLELHKIPGYVSMIESLEQVGDACTQLAGSKKINKAIIEGIDRYLEKIIIEYGKNTKDYETLKRMRGELFCRIKNMEPSFELSILWQIADLLHHIEVSLVSIV